jgi:hypothetical protein
MQERVFNLTLRVFCTQTIKRHGERINVIAEFSYLFLIS